MGATARCDWGKHWNRLGQPLESSGTHLGTRGIKWERFAFRRDARCNSWIGANMWSQTSSSVYPTSSAWPSRNPCMIFATQSSRGVHPHKDSWEMAFWKIGVFAQRGARTFRLQRHYRRQRRERVTRTERATRTPEAESQATRRTRSTRRCVCFFGGGGCRASIPLPHSNLQQRGGGFNLDSATAEQLAT